MWMIWRHVFAVAAVVLSALPAMAQVQQYGWQVLQSTTGTGAGTELDINGYNSVSIDVEMTSTGTVEFRAKGDGSYKNLACMSASDTAGALVTSVTTSRNVICSTFGLSKIQTTIAANGGTITVNARVSSASVMSGGGGGSGGGAITDIQDGTGNSVMDAVNRALRFTGVTVQSVSGNAAHDSPDAQFPVILGGHASSSVSAETLVGNGDAVRLHPARDGVLHVRDGCPLEDIVSAVVTATAGANTSGIAAQGAGIKVYLRQVILVNGGTSSGSMIVTDGSGGATKLSLPIPDSKGATFVLPLPIGFTANTAIFVDPTGSDDITVTLIGCKSKI